MPPRFIPSFLSVRLTADGTIADSAYKNYKERNVHIWAPSSFSEPTGDTSPPRDFGTLIAGFFNPSEDEPVPIRKTASCATPATYETVVQWLGLTCVKPGADYMGDSVRHKPKGYMTSWALARWHCPITWTKEISENPPADSGLPKGLPRLPFIQGTDTNVKEKDWLNWEKKYAICKILDPNDDGVNALRPSRYDSSEEEEYSQHSEEEDDPLLKVVYSHPDLTPFVSKAMKKTKTTGKDREDWVPTQVRKRDRICRVTGTAAVAKEAQSRAICYVGLEAAHIYALQFANEYAYLWVTEENKERAKTALSTRQQADRPWNVILLRADIHACFDGYHFGVYMVGGKLMIFTLEKNVPECLHQIQKELRDAKGKNKISRRTMVAHEGNVASGWRIDGLIESPASWVFQEHFFMVLMRRFVGQGRLD